MLYLFDLQLAESFNPRVRGKFKYIKYIQIMFAKCWLQWYTLINGLLG